MSVEIKQEEGSWSGVEDDEVIVVESSNDQRNKRIIYYIQNRTWSLFWDIPRLPANTTEDFKMKTYLLASDSLIARDAIIHLDGKLISLILSWF